MSKIVSNFLFSRAVFTLFYRAFIVYDKVFKIKYFFIKGMNTIGIDSSFLFF